MTQNIYDREAVLLEGGRLEGASWRGPPPGSNAGGCLVEGDGADLPLIQGVPADDRHLQLPEVTTQTEFCIFDFQFGHC